MDLMNALREAYERDLAHDFMEVVLSDYLARTRDYRITINRERHISLMRNLPFEHHAIRFEQPDDDTIIATLHGD